MAKVEPVEFDVEYSEACGQCGAATGFAMAEGGIICANRHKVEPAQASQATAPAVEQSASLETSGAFKPGAGRPRPQRQQTQPAQPAAPVEVAQVAAPQAAQVAQVLTVAGGDLEITLRIPDRHAQAVKAEAEIQHQTVSEYLQDWITEALDNFWGR